MNPIFVQTIYYGIVVILSFFGVSALLRGFFWKYVRVRLSFGRLILVKVRTVNRDYFKVGRIEENFLVYKDIGSTKRININQENKGALYKCIAVTMIDVDSDKNAIVLPDFSVVDGFDAIKFENLFERALKKPNITDKKEMLILIMLGILIAISAISVYLLYKQYNDIGIILNQLQSVSKGIVTASTTI